MPSVKMDPLTEDFEEQLAVDLSGLIEGLAGVGASIALSNVSDGQTCTSSPYGVLLRLLQFHPFPAHTRIKH